MKLHEGSREVIERLALFSDFHDSVGEKAAGYAGRWLAAAEPILYEIRLTVAGREVGEPVVVDNGWVVIVQEKYETVLKPVEEMKSKLIVLVLLALGVMALVIVILWGMVYLGVNQSSGSRVARYLRRQAGLSASAASSTVRSGSAPLRTTGSRGSGSQPHRTVVDPRAAKPKQGQQTPKQP
jgi:hypothetical protein